MEYIIKVGEVKPYLTQTHYNFYTMRKIEQQMNRAIVNKNTWSNSNTQVIYNDNTDCSEIYLHGHKIAVYDHKNEAVKLNSFGYKTNTTKSRLNAILDEVKYGAKVFQRQFDWYLSYNNRTVDFWDGMILTEGGLV